MIHELKIGEKPSKFNLISENSHHIITSLCHFWCDRSLTDDISNTTSCDNHVGN